MTKTKAGLKALRERVGLSQQNVADALRVNIKSVKNWENPAKTAWRIPDDVWNYLEKVDEAQKQQVSFFLGALSKQVEELGDEPVLVPITYYRNQTMYEQFGRDEGPVGWANAVARLTAYELERRGIAYEFRYPSEGAIKTEGSNY